MTVIRTVELHDQGAPREATRRTQSTHRGLRAARHAAQHFDRRVDRADRLCQFHFGESRSSEGKPAYGRILYGLDHGWVSVTEDGRSPRAHVVDVALSLGVGDARAARRGNEGWLTEHRTEGTHGAIDPTHE